MNISNCFATKSRVGALLSASMMMVMTFSALEAKPKQQLPLNNNRDLTPLYVENPFVTEKARLAYQNYVARLSLEYGKNITIPDEFWFAAPRMLYWGYSFAENEIGTVDITFMQKFNASDLFDAIRRVIANQRYDGCSWLYPENISLASFSKNSITFTAGLNGEIRSCGTWPWGGEWKTDVAGISGSLTGSFTFRSDATAGSGRYKGQLINNPPRVSVDLNVDDIFGINANSVAGQILAAIGRINTLNMVLLPDGALQSIWAIENRINAELYRVKENDYIHTDYMTANSGAVLSKKYADFMTSVTTLTWSIQPQNGFVINDSLTGLSYSGNDPILTIAFTARLKPFEPFETVREDIVTEIELIKSFAKDDVSHGITRGDSLWKLAKQYYGSGFYYNFLAAANNIKNSSVSRLRDGQIIVIPAMHKLSPLDGYHFLAPGETLIGLCQNWMPGQFGRCLAAIRKKNPGLSLHKIYALQGIRKPDKEEANNKP